MITSGGCRKRRCKAGVSGNRAGAVFSTVSGCDRAAAGSPKPWGYFASGGTFLTGPWPAVAWSTVSWMPKTFVNR